MNHNQEPQVQSDPINEAVEPTSRILAETEDFIEKVKKLGEIPSEEKPNEYPHPPKVIASREEFYRVYDIRADKHPDGAAAIRVRVESQTGIKPDLTAEEVEDDDLKQLEEKRKESATRKPANNASAHHSRTTKSRRRKRRNYGPNDGPPAQYADWRRGKEL